MKRLAVLTTTLCLSLNLAACKDSDESSNKDKTTANKAATSAGAKSKTTETKPKAADTKPAKRAVAKPKPVAKGPRLGDGNGFTLDFPAGFRKPRPTKRSVPAPSIPGGKIDMTMWLGARSGTEQVVVSVNKYPAAVFDNQSTKTLLDSVRAGGLKNLGAKLLRETDFKHNGVPARDVRFSFRRAGMSGYGRQHLVLSRPNLYQVVYVSTSRAKVDAPAIKAMFDSLKLTK